MHIIDDHKRLKLNWHLIDLIVFEYDSFLLLASINRRNSFVENHCGLAHSTEGTEDQGSK